MANTNSHNNEPLKISETTEPPVQGPLITQIGNCFEKIADALGQDILHSAVKSLRMSLML